MTIGLEQATIVGWRVDEEASKVSERAERRFSV